MKISLNANTLGLAENGTRIFPVRDSNLTKELNFRLNDFGIKVSNSETYKAKQGANSIEVDLLASNEEILGRSRIPEIFPDKTITQDILNERRITRLVFGTHSSKEGEFEELYVLERNCNPGNFLLRGAFSIYTDNQVETTKSTPLELIFCTAIKEETPIPSIATPSSVANIAKLSTYNAHEIVEKLKEKTLQSQNVKPESLEALKNADLSLDNADLNGLIELILQSRSELNFFTALGENRSIRNLVIENFNRYKSRINTMHKERGFYQGLILSSNIARLITRPWSEYDVPLRKAPVIETIISEPHRKTVSPNLIFIEAKEKSKKEILESLMDRFLKSSFNISNSDIEEIVNLSIEYQKTGVNDLDNKILQIAENTVFISRFIELTSYINLNAFKKQCSLDETNRVSIVNKLLEDKDISARFLPKTHKSKSSTIKKTVSNGSIIKPTMATTHATPSVSNNETNIQSWQREAQKALSGDLTSYFELLNIIIIYDQSNNRNTNDDNLAYELGKNPRVREFVNAMIKGIIDQNTTYIKNQSKLPEEKRNPFAKGVLKEAFTSIA